MLALDHPYSATVKRSVSQGKSRPARRRSRTSQGCEDVSSCSNPL